MMHDAKKSDSGIVARKAANNGAQARAEPPERRAGRKGMREAATQAGHGVGELCQAGLTGFGNT